MQQPLSSVEPYKVIDVLLSKQTQYYTLWAGYAVAQFTAAGFGLSQASLNRGVGLAVLVGFWIFNIGHLGFVLACQLQLDDLKAALRAAMNDDRPEFTERTKLAFANLHEGQFFLRWPPSGRRKLYWLNIAVHLSIDTCASLALLWRLYPSTFARLLY